MTGLSSSAILVWLVQLLFLASLSCFVSHPNLLSLLLLIAAPKIQIPIPREVLLQGQWNGLCP